ncbi:hypothetical protein [Parasphingorhabdus litoris]|uniref:hypothetical protein n=1 Tax=Parasphingorhabdus litoris TaxID=394733 RepID=UPI001E65D2A4|nr:hypothetical protein [Parasphingorhabdus litoris]
MKKSISTVFAIATLSMSSSVSAAAWCQGYIDQILTYDSGQVGIYSTWRSGWTTICNVKTEWKGIPPEICFVWFSTASSSITENKQVIVYYRTIDQADCATISAGLAAPAPGYVRLIK